MPKSVRDNPQQQVLALEAVPTLPPAIPTAKPVSLKLPKKDKSPQELTAERILDHLTYLDGTPPAFIDQASEARRYYGKQQVAIEIMHQYERSSFRDGHKQLHELNILLDEKLHFCCRLGLCWIRYDEKARRKLLAPDQIFNAAEVLFGAFSDAEKTLIKPVLNALPNMWRDAVLEKFSPKTLDELKELFLQEMALSYIKGSTTADPHPGLALPNLYRRALEKMYGDFS
jgi:hypothetical protein